MRASGITLGQRLLAALWQSPARRLQEALARRFLGQRVLAGPLRGRRFDGGLAQRLGIYELEVQRALLLHLRPGDVCFDVGAHRGYLTLLAARRVGPGGYVFAFDPVPDNAARVRQALITNGVVNALVEPAAVSDAVGYAELYFQSGGANTIASLIPGGGPDRLRVPVTTLDAFAAEHRPPDLVKVDVEGAEERVLAGAGRLLAGEQPPTWLLELHTAEAEEAVRQRLADHGYRWQALATHRAADYPRHAVALPRSIPRC